jgi:hypothetical protein
MPTYLHFAIPVWKKQHYPKSCGIFTLGQIRKLLEDEKQAFYIEWFPKTAKGLSDRTSKYGPIGFTRLL